MNLKFWKKKQVSIPFDYQAERIFRNAAKLFKWNPEFKHTYDLLLYINKYKPVPGLGPLTVNKLENSLIDREYEKETLCNDFMILITFQLVDRINKADGADDEIIITGWGKELIRRMSTNQHENSL